MKKIIEMAMVFITIQFISSYSIANTSDRMIEKAKNASVLIKTVTSLTPYNDNGTKQGTGFINDKKNGLIVTNFHMTTYEGIGKYTVTFHTGQQVDAKLIFYSLWQDFAILQVDPNQIPKSATEIKFSSKEVKIGDPVFIVGNNESYGFSFHNGHVSDLYLISGLMPQQSYVVNLNSTGGSSGSPLVNHDGDAVALNYGGGQTSAFCLKGAYIQDALTAILNSRAPLEKHIGIVTKLQHLDEMVKHQNLSKEIIEPYMKKYHDARGRVISIEYIIAGSPAEKILQPGDIIWKINNKTVGPSLYELDKLLNQSSDKVNIEFYRFGKKYNLDVPTYNVNENKIGELLDFGGAIFFKTNDLVSRITGIPMNKLAVVNIKAGAPFSVIEQGLRIGNDVKFRITPFRLNSKKINSVSDIVELIPEILKKEYGSIDFKNFQMHSMNFAGIYVTGNLEYLTNIVFDSVIEAPRLYTMNNTSFNWESRNIGVNDDKKSYFLKPTNMKVNFDKNLVK